MTIDLTKLSGVLKTLGDLSNIETPNDTELKGKEESIFKGYADNALKSGSISEAEYSAIFGLEKSNVTTNNNNVTTPSELSKKDIKRNKNAVKESIEGYIKEGVAPQDLMKKLKTEYQNPEYAQQINDVEFILNAIPAYNSKDDVEKIHDTVKKQLKATKKWNNFTQDVLKLLETQAEATQIGKEFESLKAMYVEVKDTMAGTDIVKEKGNNYKAYVEIVKDQLQEKGADGKKAWNQSYTKEAFVLLEDYAKEDAEAVVSSRLAKTEENTSKKIAKELKAANKGGDKYQKDAIESLEVEREAFARKNTIEDRAEELKNISREDLRKELGKDLFEKLNRAYLGNVKNSQGNYDLSQLSKEIMTRVGIDYQVNYSSDHEMAELTNIQRHLKSTMGIDFTEKEVKKLMDLCDIKEQKKDRSFKTAINEGLGGIPSILTGAITGLAVSRTLNVNQTVRIPFNNKELAQEVLNTMKELGYEPEYTELLGNEAEIKVHQHVFKDTRILDSLLGMGIGVLTNTLMALAFGKEIDEKSCMSISDYDINDEKYTNVEKYKEYIAQTYTNPKKVEAIQVLADTYYKQYGDDWHVHYHQALRDMAGIGSKLNPDECRMMKYQTPAVDKTGEPDKMPAKAKQDKRPAESSPVRDCVNNDCNAKIKQEYHDTTYTYTKQGGETWAGIVEAFYPCLTEDGTPMYNIYKKLPNGKKVLVKEGAIGKLKRALSYNENGTFNEKIYKKLLEGGDLPKTMKLPIEIDGCKRVDNARVEKDDVKGDGKALIQEVGNKSGYTTYTASDDCTEATATGKTKQEALAKLKEKTRKEYTNEAELLK